MITRVSHNLFVADIEGHTIKSGKDTAILHACKYPCYDSVSNNDVSTRSLDYLFIEQGNNMYLNIIDSGKPLFYKDTFDFSLLFIEKHINEREVIIHCNKGQSRSPSIAMLYLFRDLKYREAQNRMYDIYPYYNPSLGIDEYLGNNWKVFQK